MKRFIAFLRGTFRLIAGWIGSFVLWTVWLALVLLLIVQIYVATTNELAVPKILLQQLEQRLAESGVRAKFERTSLDPTGRVLMEDVRLSLPAFVDPVVHARAIYVRVSPWPLAVGRVEPGEIRITGARVIVPAILSPSGEPVEIVRDLDATIVPASRELTISQLTARVAGVRVSAQGTLPLPRRGTPLPPQALAEFLAQRFTTAARQALAAAEKLAAFETPALHIDFSPSESGGLQAQATFLTRSAELKDPVALAAKNVRVESRVLVLEGVATVSRIDAAIGELRLPFAGGVAARGLRATVYGRLRPGDYQFETRALELFAAALTAGGVNADGVSAELFPRPFPRLDGVVTATIGGAALVVRGESDFGERTATARLRGALSPQILDVVSSRARIDVRRFFDFDALECAEAEVRFDPGWKFHQLAAELSLQQIRAHGVTFDEGRASVVLDGQRFRSPQAYGRIGSNFARGSYEHELATRKFRFLLDGELRPMDISGWFAAWWPNFFRQFEFPSAAPVASVDVQGVWREGQKTAVFVRADAAAPIIRGVPLDHVRTRLFVRPGFFDGLHLFVKSGTGTLRGSFIYVLDGPTREWRSFDFKADSTLDLSLLRRLGGPGAANVLAPFQLATAPELRASGRFEGPTSPRGRQTDFQIQAATAGEFRFFNFPLQDVTFSARLHSDELTIENMQARFGGGTATGRARVWGQGAERRLGFDYALKDANLGEAAAALEDFLARQQSRPARPPGKFVQEKANVRINVAASAEGRYTDLLSYRGSGNAVLEGPELGQIPLLGALSEVLKFTALRFTSARANFKIEGAKLVFPEVAIRGANSAIDAHGDYSLDRHELDFNARIFPFQESEGLIKSVVGVVLSPLSNVFEVKLAGTLEKPAWRLVLGPTNILKSLSPEARESGVKPPPPGEAPTTGASTPPATSTDRAPDRR